MSKRTKQTEQVTSKVVDIAARLKAAEDEKDWVEVCDILYDACDYDPETLTSIVPRFIEHHYWNLRATVVEVVGIRRLVQFSGLVAARLRDRNAIVRSYALMAYYELLGAKALPVIDEFCAVKDVRVRLTALALRYIQTGDRDTLKRIARILGRKGCRFLHRAATLNVFDYYCDPRPDNEVVEMFAAILPDVPKEFGKAKQMESMLAKWRRQR